MRKIQVFILSFFSLYSSSLLNDLSLKALHSPSGRHSFTKFTGLFSLYLRSTNNTRKTDGLAFRYKPLKIHQTFCYNYACFAITRFDNFQRSNPGEFRKLLYRTLEDKTQLLGLQQTFHQILSSDRRDEFIRRQKWRHYRATLTLTSFFMVSCSRSAFLIASCSSLSRVSKCLLWLFCVSISTSMSCC